MKGNNMSKHIETNMNYRDLMNKVARLERSLVDLIEDAKLLREKFRRFQTSIDDSIKPNKG
jgi:hypothetical protein